MGKVTRDIAASDTSVDERKKIVREKQKIRTKKKKRKRDLTDLHQKLSKLKKDKETKIDGKLHKARSSKRISNRILPRLSAGIYRNGAAGKEIRRSQVKLPVNDSNNARLQGNVLKLIDGYDSKAEGIVVENNINEASKNPFQLDSTIRNILQPTPLDDQSISPILGKVDGRKGCGRDEHIINLDIPKPLEKRKTVDSERLRNAALSKYEELCTVISENFEGQHFPDHFTADPLTAVKKKLRNIYAESFRSQFLRDMIKRGVILNDCNMPSTSEKNLLPLDTECCSSGYNQDANLVSVVSINNPDLHIGYKRNKEGEDLHENQNPLSMSETNLNIDSKRNEIATSNLLFDLSLLNPSDSAMKNFIEPEMTKKTNNILNEDDCTNASNHTFLEPNYSATSTYSTNTIKYFEVNELQRIKEKSKPILFVPTEAGLHNNFVNKKQLIKRKNQRTQTAHVLNSGLKAHAGKQNVKIPQQFKVKNLKHIPAILRRCNNAAVNNNSRLNLFQEPMHINKEPRKMLFDAASKQNVLFTSESLITELNENSRRLQTSSSVNALFDTEDTKDLNVQTCVIDSPSLRNDHICFIKSSCPQSVKSKQQSQNFHVNDIFVNKKNPQVQKTVMFTKKDSRNIGHCLHLNNLIADRSVDNSNVCIIRKNAPLQHEKSTKNICSVHNNCQTVRGNCYKTYQCSQSSETLNCSSQELKEASTPQVHHVQVHQKPMVCEKVLLRRVQQHPKRENIQKCHKDKHVCYVVVDQCKDSNNMQKCSNDNVTKIEKSRILHEGRYCQEDMADVGILKGVQNLKILPMEEQESQIKFTGNQCIENAVVLEEQPIKYLAFENDSKTQKIPIYMQRNKHVASVDNVEVINPNVNYRLVSYPQESTQKVIYVPSCEQNKVVYVKQQNLPHSNVAFEECSHPRKVVLYRPEVQCINDSSVCEVHVPKQNVMEIRKNECDTIVTNLQQADNIKKSKRGVVNWEELHYRPNHDHDACVRNQAIFYQK